MRASTRRAPPALVPELAVRTAGEVVPLWHAVERFLGREGTEPPFWAWPWPGSQVIARTLLDDPGLARGRRVLDFASGGGLAAVAAARCGARVTACELDPLAIAALRVNAGDAGVEVRAVLGDLTGAVPADIDLVIAGDTCYERAPAARIVAWLHACAAAGLEVWLADPGRAWAPTAGVDWFGTWDVPTSVDLENVAVRRTRLGRVVGPVTAPV